MLLQWLRLLSSRFHISFFPHHIRQTLAAARSSVVPPALPAFGRVRDGEAVPPTQPPLVLPLPLPPPLAVPTAAVVLAVAVVSVPVATPPLLQGAVPLRRWRLGRAKGAERPPAGEAGHGGGGGRRRLGGHRAQAAGAGPTRGAAGLDAELRGAAACRHKVAFILSLGRVREGGY